MQTPIQVERGEFSLTPVPVIDVTIVEFKLVNSPEVVTIEVSVLVTTFRRGFRCGPEGFE